VGAYSLVSGFDFVQDVKRLALSRGKPGLWGQDDAVVIWASRSSLHIGERHYMSMPIQHSFKPSSNVKRCWEEKKIMWHSVFKTMPKSLNMKNSCTSLGILTL